MPKEATQKGEEWMEEIPNCVKQGGVKQLVMAFETNFAKKKKNTEKSKFEVHFRSKKKCLTEVIDFDKRSTEFLKGNNSTSAFIKVLATKLGRDDPNDKKKKKTDKHIPLCDSKKTISRLLEMKCPPCDFKVQYRYKTKEWYLLIPYPFGKEEKKPIPKHDVVSLDPGSRTFLTAYSQTGGCGKLLVDGLKKTKKNLARIDSLQSIMTKIKSEGKGNKYGENAIRNRTSLIHKLWKKIKDTRHHMHYTTCNFLLNNFKVILLPNSPPNQHLERAFAIVSKS